MKTKKIDLGEYVIKISYDQETGELNVDVYDEGDEIIESINIKDSDNEDDEDENDKPSFCLN